MANKTAMQELLEWVRKTLPMDLDTPRMIEDKIESLLEVEEKQIRDAWTDGCIGELYELNAYFSSGKYYNETYNKES
jgi:hypothetical protein